MEVDSLSTCREKEVRQLSWVEEETFTLPKVCFSAEKTYMNITVSFMVLAVCAEIWSPAGGFFADPKHWRRNTAVAVMYVVVCICFVWNYVSLWICVYV